MSTLAITVSIRIHLEAHFVSLLVSVKWRTSPFCISVFLLKKVGHSKLHRRYIEETLWIVCYRGQQGWFLDWSHLLQH